MLLTYACIELQACSLQTLLIQQSDQVGYLLLSIHLMDDSFAQRPPNIRVRLNKISELTSFLFELEFNHKQKL